jgi:hypothetical protein
VAFQVWVLGMSIVAVSIQLMYHECHLANEACRS